MIYLLTAIGLSHGGSTHLHTNNKQNNTNTTYCGRVRAVPRLCEFYSGICLTTEEKARKNLSQGKKNLSQVKKNLCQSTVYILPKHPHITKPSQTHTLQNPLIHTHTHTHTHTLQNNIKPPQYKLKQNAYRKSNSTQFLMLLIRRYNTIFSRTFTSLHCTSPHFTSPTFMVHPNLTPFTALHFTSLHFTALHYTSLHFTALLDSLQPTHFPFSSTH